MVIDLVPRYAVPQVEQGRASSRGGQYPSRRTRIRGRTDFEVMGGPKRMTDARSMGVDELARRLDMDLASIRAIKPVYRTFTIRKRNGHDRVLHIPSDALKAVQRRILRRILGKLKAHPAACGFEKGQSIVTHARRHSGKEVVLKMDIKNFFPRTRGTRVFKYFRRIGWDREASRLLTRLTVMNYRMVEPRLQARPTGLFLPFFLLFKFLFAPLFWLNDSLFQSDTLPQGAPTSPRLSNLVNRQMDVRMSWVARKLGGDYSRYADDITISFPAASGAGPGAPFHYQGEKGTVPLASYRANPRRAVTAAIYFSRWAVGIDGYTLHSGRKLQVRRRNRRQTVTGLVVNERPALPRETRRRLRAVEHHLATGRPATMTPEQLAGWKALNKMIETQRTAPPPDRSGPRLIVD